MMQELEPLHIYSKYAVWSSCESPKKWGVGAVWVSVPCHCIHFLLPGLPGQTSVGEDVLSAVGTRSPKMGWYSKGASASLKTRGGSSGGERFVIVGLGGEEGGEEGTEAERKGSCIGAVSFWVFGTWRMVSVACIGQGRCH